VIILLDGNPAIGYHAAFPLLARRFNRAGFNVALLVAPRHLQRHQGIHDLFGGPQLIEELWQKWKQPEIGRLPHGHVSLVSEPGLTGRVLDWLKPRLDTGRENNL
jgi:hypothetical protein